MTFIRPEITATLWRWREVLVTSTFGCFGLWLASLGGWILVPIGLIVLALSAALTRHAIARLRFQQATGAPGLVELDEAQLAYLGPEVGGFISLDEAVELRVVSMRGRRLWRIKQADGQAMLVPVDAAGAGQLFDAFAGLPGMDVTALARAATATRPVLSAVPDRRDLVSAGVPEMTLIWRRSAKAGLTAR